MLIKVEARTPQGTVLSMSPQEAQNGVILAEILGLDPVKAQLVSSPFANLDGAKYRSGRRETRNMIFKFELESDYRDYTIQEVRRRLYGTFMPKMPVTFTFYDSDGPTVSILGRVETLEAPMFTQEPAMNLSVICFAPDFVAVTPQTFTGTTIQSTVDQQRTYDGSTPAGIEFWLRPNRALSSFSIYNRPPDGTLHQLDFAGVLQANDVLYINTKQGEKKVLLTRGGVETSLLYGLSPKSDWITLEPGINNYRVYATGAAIPYTITYSDRYGGL